MNNTLDSVIVVDEPQFTVDTDVPLNQQGFHWQFDSSNKVKVHCSLGKVVRGYSEGDEVGRGFVVDITPREGGYRCHVEPPTFEQDV